MTWSSASRIDADAGGDLMRPATKPGAQGRKIQTLHVGSDDAALDASGELLVVQLRQLVEGAPAWVGGAHESRRKGATLAGDTTKLILVVAI